jgi:hypothetical protein
MNYFLVKTFTAILGINKALAETRTGGTTPRGSYALPNPLGVQTFTEIINNVAYYLTVYIAPSIVTIMILIAGFYFLTAGENPERVKTARQIILWTVIGYAIILISWGVTSIIQELLGGASI